ncbi:MAG TPA: polysaccharide biosynthesis/export family protein [Chitinophagaceae bacterium]|jgi:polysaccharide export outer membrane protein|nr:polysaccharide biosynthesis/export family protein [Chitinophagaceae bacterium]
MKRLTIPVLLFSILIYSCRPTKPMGNYLENFNDTTGKSITQIPELKIQKGDLLGVQVYSISTEPKVYELYNLPCAVAATSATGSANTCGYLVDAQGNIIHPRLGVIHAAGLTKTELAEDFKKRLTSPKELLSDPTVIVNFLNYKITVLGEVAQPGTLSIPGEKVTILEAIGLAGDITEYGKKNNVKIIRESDGVRTVGTIDLSSKKLFESPYFNLSQNDVVLVNPIKQKNKKTEQEVTMARVGFIISLITSASLIYNSFRRN